MYRMTTYLLAAIGSAQAFPLLGASQRKSASSSPFWARAALSAPELEGEPGLTSGLKRTPKTP